MSEHGGKTQILIYIGLYFLAVLMLFCLVTLMHSFMGGRADNPDVVALGNLQIGGSLLSAVIIGVALAFFARENGLRPALRRIWEHTPGWLVFSLILLNSLVFIGELSYVLIGHAIDPTKDRADHLSLICLLLASLAFLALFATQHVRSGNPPFSKERW